MGVSSSPRGADAMINILPKTKRLMKTATKSEISKAKAYTKRETSRYDRIYSSSAKSEMFHKNLLKIKYDSRRKK